MLLYYTDDQTTTIQLYNFTRSMQSPKCKRITHLAGEEDSNGGSSVSLRQLDMADGYQTGLNLQ